MLQTVNGVVEDIPANDPAYILASVRVTQAKRDARTSISISLAMYRVRKFTYACIHLLPPWRSK